MAKRRSFEDILNAEFRWPEPADRPFVVADNPVANASVSEDGFTRLVLMTDGYKEAADLMVQASKGSGLKRSMLVCPIIFNYRQFLELSLKYQLATYGRMVDIDPNWSSHDLTTLWTAFVEMLDRYEPQDPDETISHVEGTILEFAKIDPKSYSYRYPVDNKGRPIPIAYTDLHLPTLADVMDGVANFFKGCDGHLDHLAGANPY